MAPIRYSRFANSEYISFAYLGYASAMIDTIYGGDEQGQRVERFEVVSPGMPCFKTCLRIINSASD
jgi:hypothetical protein